MQYTKQTKPKQFRAVADSHLHRAVKAAAKAAHMSIAGWLLKAAEEKLARDAKPGEGGKAAA